MRTSEDRASGAMLVAFGQLLKRLRIAADLTQEELAERAMVSARSISDLERGSSHRPRRDTVQMLADGLGLRGAERDAFVALGRGRAAVQAPEPVAQSPVHHAVPHPPTPIVGRLKETSAVTGLVLDPEVRLLTLTGPGGVGKTRLALEVAHRVMGAFPDGAAFVDLAPVRDPELVLSAIAQGVRVVTSPEVPLRQALHDALREARLLLILDNFEHVPAAAVVVADLLAACPGLTALATSRTPLHIRVEQEYEVGPLALPEPGAAMVVEELARVPAVDLFVRRAEVANRAFALTPGNAPAVAEIAIRLDGLPLAIELAATRMKILSPAALLARMEQRLPLLTRGPHDLPLRQQAMRATLDWSHELLSPEEQRLFRRLAVFAGGCTVEAAEFVSRAERRQAGQTASRQVLSGETEASSHETSSSMTSHHFNTRHPTPDTRHPSPTFVLDLLADLVDKSLLRPLDDLGDDRRFGMLETIREYGLERLAEANEEEDARGRHQAWCIDLAERADPRLLGPEQHQWFSRLEIEHDNLRVALGWAIATGQAEAALRLTGSLYRFWANQGYYEEGRRWLEQALGLDPSACSAARGHALIGLGVMVFFQGEYDQAAALWEESLALFRRLDDITGIAYSHGNLGLIADARGDYPRAVAEYEAALALFRQKGDRTYISFMLHNLGLIAYFEGEYARARTLFEESLALVRELGDWNSVAMTLGNLGLVAFAEGDYPLALALQREALTDWQRLSNRPWLVRSLEHFALIAAATAEPERAARLFGAAAALRQALGASQPRNDRELNERYIAEARVALGEPAFGSAWAQGEAMTLEEALCEALGRV